MSIALILHTLRISILQRTKKTFIYVSELIGVMSLLLKQKNVEIHNVNNSLVKQRIGIVKKSATKRDVQEKIADILKMDSIPKPDDVADALAIAYVGVLEENK